METGLLVGGRVVVEAALAAGPRAPTGSVAGFVALAKSVREMAWGSADGPQQAADTPRGVWVRRPRASEGAAAAATDAAA
ncbi:MAG: hypothetical protein GY772_22675 [bacterium]|nr:hypothetical protein [bacterium]